NLDDTFSQHGLLWRDYINADTQFAVSHWGNWFAPNQSGDGVWFASGPIRYEVPGDTLKYDNKYVTVRYSEGRLANQLSERTDLTLVDSTPLPFFRAHITRENLRNVIRGIKTF